ncbi:response regulator [Oligoflexus tunisiensis]|uniref:response regulator n=1 Tax=Oligoflexus tunisiensis TaxID=708132 RepID=UPI00114CC41B|nr:response regulator [Oligoflexus tunisiensis]
MSQTYKILVAEDNELMLELLATEVKDYLVNVSLTRAHDGLEAMKQAMSQTFDLILSDNVMPGMLGSAVLREVRGSSGPNQDTPFIFCSGNFSQDEVKGIKDCYLLQKPFDMRKLHGLLARLLQVENPHFACTPGMD